MASAALTSYFFGRTVAPLGRQTVEGARILTTAVTKALNVLEQHPAMIEKTRGELIQATGKIEKLIQVALDLYAEARVYNEESRRLNKESRELLEKAGKAVTHR